MEPPAGPSTSRPERPPGPDRGSRRWRQAGGRARDVIPNGDLDPGTWAYRGTGGTEIVRGHRDDRIDESSDRPALTPPSRRRLDVDPPVWIQTGCGKQVDRIRDSGWI